MNYNPMAPGDPMMAQQLLAHRMEAQPPQTGLGLASDLMATALMKYGQQNTDQGGQGGLAGLGQLFTKLFHPHGMGASQMSV